MNGIPPMPCSPNASRAVFFFGKVQGAFEQHEKGGVDFLVAHTGEKRFPGEAADALDGQRAVFLEEPRVDARIAQEDVGKAVLDVLEVALFLAKAGVDAFLIERGELDEPRFLEVGNGFVEFVGKAPAEIDEALSVEGDHRFGGYRVMPIERDDFGNQVCFGGEVVVQRPDGNSAGVRDAAHVHVFEPLIAGQGEGCVEDVLLVYDGFVSHWSTLLDAGSLNSSARIVNDSCASAFPLHIRFFSLK